MYEQFGSVKSTVCKFSNMYEYECQISITDNSDIIVKNIYRCDDVAARCVLIAQSKQYI